MVRFPFRYQCTPGARYLAMAAAAAVAFTAVAIEATAAVPQVVPPPNDAPPSKAPQLKPAKPVAKPTPAAKPAAPFKPLTDAEYARLEKSFDRPEAILGFIYGYKLKPEPRLVLGAVRAMVRFGVFRDGDTSGIYTGFVAGVIASLKGDAPAFVETLFPMPAEDQVGLVKAIAMSGHSDWQILLRNMAERMPARATLIDRYLTGKLSSLSTLQLNEGSAPLDILWGHYYATGGYDPVLRIISVLPWSRDQNDVEKLTLGVMAKFTLASNAARDIELQRMLKAALKHEPVANQATLREIIDAAELAEVGKIRKDAMTAIETLKIKGPQNARTTQWWGMAGQTALALGCVVASALGQVQFGIPCVVGGALSGAALKLTEPQK